MVKNSQIKSRISAICIYIVLILVNIAYCPGIILTSNYKIAVSISIIFIFTGIIINLNHTFKHLVKLFLIPIVIILTYSSIIFCYNGIFPLYAYSNLFISALCFAFGFCTYNKQKNTFYQLSVTYILSAIFLGIYSTIMNLGAFQVTDIYAFSVKNSSSVLLATAMLLCLFLINNSTNVYSRMLWVIASILLFVCIMTFRSRTCMIGITLIYLTFIIRNKTSLTQLVLNKNFLIITCCLVTAITLFDFDFSSYAYEALFAGKDTDDYNSVTSGRIGLFQLGWETFKENQMFGNMQLEKRLPPIDNFVLYQLASYGLVGAFWNIVAYLLVWTISIKGIICSPVKKSYPFYALFLLCLVSITEGPFPFGPGTPVICSWFLLGWWYRSAKYPLTNI